MVSLGVIFSLEVRETKIVSSSCCLDYLGFPTVLGLLCTHFRKNAVFLSLISNKLTLDEWQKSENMQISFFCMQYNTEDTKLNVFPARLPLLYALFSLPPLPSKGHVFGALVGFLALIYFFPSVCCFCFLFVFFWGGGRGRGSTLVFSSKLQAR